MSRQRKQTPATSSPATFRTVRRGYEPGAVDAALDQARAAGAQLEVVNSQARTHMRALLDELDRLHALEDELVKPVHLARQAAANIVTEATEHAEHLLAEATQHASLRLVAAEQEAMDRIGTARREADACVAAAHGEAAGILAAGRAELAAEALHLENHRLAIAAEAMVLANIEKRLGDTISRAGAALVELVDAPGGLGPFSRATTSLVDFARLLQGAKRTGGLGEVRIELVDGVAHAALHVTSAAAVSSAAPSPLVDLRGPAPAAASALAAGVLPAGVAAAAPAGTPAADGTGGGVKPNGVPGTGRPRLFGHSNAANNSSIAFN